MKITRIVAAICVALLVLAGTAPASAQSNNILVVSSCGNQSWTSITATQLGILTVDTTGKLCVNATVSASVSGFTPGGTFATLTATGTSASVALPAGTTVAIQNTGTTTVSCTLGIGSAVAVASEIQVPASSSVFVSPGSNTFGACIDQTGSTSNLVVLAGGSGLGTGFGGGGGGGGGGGAITAASGSYASGAMSAGSYAAGALAAGAFASGAGVDGWDLTQGAIADAVVTAGATGSVSAKLRAISRDIGTIATNTGAVIPTQATSVPIGGVTNDPCQYATKTNFTIATSSGTVQLVAPSGSTQVYICSLFSIGATASIQNIVGGTGAACTTGTPVAMAGSTTAANGMSFAANGGFTFGNGGGTVLRTTTAGHGVCLIQSATAALAGGGTFVQQ